MCWKKYTHTCTYMCVCMIRAVGVCRVAGNYGEHLIWRNGSQMVLAKLKFGELNAVCHIMCTCINYYWQI